MQGQQKRNHSPCPCPVAAARAEAQAAFEKVADFCRSSEDTFWRFEKQLLVLMMALGVCLIRLFLVARRERLQVQPFLQDGTYRLGNEDAQRTVKTVYGEVT